MFAKSDEIQTYSSIILRLICFLYYEKLFCFTREREQLPDPNFYWPLIKDQRIQEGLFFLSHAELVIKNQLPTFTMKIDKDEIRLTFAKKDDSFVLILNFKDPVICHGFMVNLTLHFENQDDTKYHNYADNLNGSILLFERLIKQIHFKQIGEQVIEIILPGQKTFYKNSYWPQTPNGQT